MTDHSSFASIPIVTSSYCVESYQWRWPRSKKKRIRKKWAKDPRNWRERPVAYLLNAPNLTVYQPRPRLVAHPAIVALIRERIERAAADLQTRIDNTFLGKEPSFRKVYE